MRLQMGGLWGISGHVSFEEMVHQYNRKRVSVTEAIKVMELPRFD